MAVEARVGSPRGGGDALFTRRFWLACSVHFSGAMALSLYILFPLFIRHLGGSRFTIGLYAGMTGAAAVAARLPVGRLLDSQGRHRVLAGAGLLHVAAWLGLLSVGELGVRSVLFVLLYGTAAGSLFASYFTYASDIVPASRRSEGIAMFGIWGILPNGLGPLAGEFLITRSGFHTYFIVAATFAFVSLCLSLALPETADRKRSHENQQASASVPVPWRQLIFLLFTTFMFGAAVESLFTFFAPFAYSEGRGNVGKFFMSYALTAVAVRVATGRLPDRVGLRRVLIPALFLYAVGILSVPRVTNLLPLILVGMLCGAGHGYSFPILNVLTVQLVAPSYRGRAVSWFTAMFDLGNTLANPALGAIAQWAGYRTMFTTSGLAILITAAVFWRRGPHSHEPPGADVAVHRRGA
ncbi:MAG: MFS transporter [Candidatus Binatia bacterium]